MALRGLDPKKIANLCDVVERIFSKMSTRFEASLDDRAKEEVSRFETSSDDQDKDRTRKVCCICLWRWILPIWKRVFWLIKQHVHDRRWHNKVEVEEVGFVDQFIRSDMLEIFVEDIPNLVDVGMDISFHD